MIIHTIGFTKKTAETFFELINRYKPALLLDIRLNNSSQLAGYSKGNDLQYFLREICGIEYVHDLTFAPSKDLLDRYKMKAIDWVQYTKEYESLLEDRDAIRIFGERYDMYPSICLLCSEPTADRCHRRLLAESICRTHPECQIHHL